MTDLLLHPMHLPLWLAAGCLLAAAACRRMTHVRLLSIAAAALLLLHGLLAGEAATAALGALMLPLHALRLWAHRQAVARHRRGQGHAPGLGYSPRVLPIPSGLDGARNETPPAAPVTGFGLLVAPAASQGRTVL